MKRMLRLLCGTVAGLCMFAGAAQATEKIRIGWVYAMANAPVFIADEKGYFKDAGIDAEIISFNSGPLVNQALAAGELDMAYVGAPPVYHWYSRGLKSKILAKVNYGQAAVIVRKDSGIDDMKGLKGKKLAGVRKGSGMDVLLRGYVLGEAAGLAPDKDVQLIPMPPGNMGASVESQVVDGAFIWEPFTSQFLLRGNTKIIFDMNQSVPNHPWYVVMALPATLEKKRDAVMKVLQAHKRAVDYLNSSPTAGNDIIAAAFKLEDITDADGKVHPAAEVVAEARQRLGWAWDINDGDMAFIQRLMNYSHSLGFINEPMKAEDLVDLSLLRQATAVAAAK